MQLAARTNEANVANQNNPHINRRQSAVRSCACPANAPNNAGMWKQHNSYDSDTRHVPEPVCPYAKQLALPPSNTKLTRCLIVRP
jgi:hypothetical protein